MKKTIAALLVFVLPVSLCYSAAATSICFALDGTIIQCNDDAAFSGVDNLNLQNQPIGLGPNVLDDYSPALTYTNLAADSFMPSDIMKEVQVIIVPTPRKFQEPFISLSQDAREQELWSWRDVVEASLPKKLNYNFSMEDVTGRGNVRVFNAKIGVEYETSENTTIGVEAIRGIHDSQDAAAWGEKAKEEKAAQVKYKIFF